MGRNFRGMETPEQAYARQTAPARVEEALQRAVYHSNEAAKAEQRTTEMYCTTEEQRKAGLPFSRPSRDADRHRRDADQHRQQAEAASAEARQALEDAEPKKRFGLF